MKPEEFTEINYICVKSGDGSRFQSAAAAVNSLWGAGSVHYTHINAVLSVRIRIVLCKERASS